MHHHQKNGNLNTLADKSLFGSETFSFAAVPRDQYYSVHGEKTTQPRSGFYHPRFNVIERRVSGVPVYQTRKNLKKSYIARERVEKWRYDKFEGDKVCEHIYKVLDVNRTHGGSFFNARNNGHNTIDNSG